MASFFSSILYPPLFYAPSHPYPAITEEEFHAFYFIDRTLFARLVMELECNPDQALEVMSLLFWLECISFTSVIETILKFPNPKLQILFNEALLCLKLVSDEYSVVYAGDVVLPLIQSVAWDLNICPKFFVDNQVEILCGLIKVFRHVCLNAFNDILEKVSLKQKSRLSSSYTVPVIGLSLFTVVANGSRNYKANTPMPVGTMSNVSTTIPGTWSYINLLLQPFQGCDVMEMLRRMRLSNWNWDVKVPAEWRTIYLTFSKGYPISAKEVKYFFTRKFGDVVEEVQMANVPKHEQPLYSWLVLRHRSSVVKILQGAYKIMYMIDRKHIWAREFVPRCLRQSKAAPTTANDIDMNCGDIDWSESKFLKFFNQ